VNQPISRITKLEANNCLMIDIFQFSARADLIFLKDSPNEFILTDNERALHSKEKDIKIAQKGPGKEANLSSAFPPIFFRDFTLSAHGKWRELRAQLVKESSDDLFSGPQHSIKIWDWLISIFLLFHTELRVRSNLGFKMQGTGVLRGRVGKPTASLQAV
jgi:hypothetical protein